MHDTKPTPTDHRPQTTPAGTTADKGAAPQTAPALRSVMHGDPSMLTPGEIAERRTMRYVVEPPDHKRTEWNGFMPLTEETV